MSGKDVCVSIMYRIKPEFSPFLAVKKLEAEVLGLLSIAITVFKIMMLR